VALHEQCVGVTDEWYTPAHVFTALDTTFDVDVSSPGREVTPWIPAERFITSDSLAKTWDGFVWMNPPFGRRNGLVPWLDKFIRHGSGICLVPDRTSAPWWQWWAKQMDLILFVSPKLRFIDCNGHPRKSPPQGTCLGALGYKAQEALRRAALSGLGFLASPILGEQS
jgi:hypothetical protein